MEILEVWRTATKEGRSALITLVVVVLAGYVSTAFTAGGAFSAARWAVMIAFGCVLIWVYLIDAINDNPRTDHYNLRFFGTTVLLIFVISYLAQEHSQMWLLTFPPVGSAIEYVSGWKRWAALASMPAAYLIPLILQFGTAAISPMLVTLVPAYLFVIAFTNLQLEAKRARHSAETLAEDLAEANTQLATYATQAEDLATTKERNRLAREIHDNLGHYLTVVNVQLEAAKLIVTKDPDKAHAAIVKAQRMTQEGLQSIRQSVAALREDAVANRPVSEAIAQLVEDSRTSGLETNYTVHGDPRDLDPKTKLTLYRVAQEGLTNIRKHAQATKVDLDLDYTDSGKVTLIVEDNGKGSDDPDGGFGLVGMRERIHLLGGDIDIKTAPQQGFRLAVAIPA